MPFKEDIRSVTVPGCVDGWLALHERFGRLPLDRVLAPAIGYARDGFPASTMLAASIPVLPDVARVRGSARRRPAARKPGETIRRPGVARALDAIVSDGRAGFYEGEFGEGLLELGQGEYAAADFEAPGARWVDPISVEAFDHILWGIPPSSQGYLLLSSAWIADGLPPARRPRRSALGAPADRGLEAGGPRSPATCCTTGRRRRAAVDPTASRRGAGRSPSTARPPWACRRGAATRPRCASSTATESACRSSSRTPPASGATSSSRRRASTCTTEGSASRSRRATRRSTRPAASLRTR